MKLIAREFVTRLWMVFLLAGLSMVMVSSLSFAAPLQIGGPPISEIDFHSVIKDGIMVSPGLQIGDKYGGGTIVSIDASGKHGLIALNNDLPGPKFKWEEANKACESINKTRMALSQRISNPGLGVWRLPNREELDQLYQYRSNKSKLKYTTLGLAVRGFFNDHYWSSTKTDSEGGAYGQYFGSDIPNFASGAQGPYSQSNTLRVRPVRSF